MSDKSFLSSKMFALTGLGISAAAISSYFYYNLTKKWKLLTPPTNWKLVGKLDEIIYYPIKSCAGITLNSANCDILGIAEGKCKDRQFMLLNENNKLVSARVYPKILKIQPKIIDGNLYVTAPNMEQLKIDYENFVKDGRSDIKAELWEKPVYVTECGELYDKWFSRFLLDKDSGLKLVYYPFPMPTKAIVSKIFENGIFTINDTGSLQDVSSYMLLNKDSVNDLNTKLKEKVSHKNFRGNFIVKTTNGEAYAEDNWNWIKIGNDAMFRKVSPCYRCTFTNINPFTAERSKDFEPLRTLKSYRISGNVKDPQMGIQMGIRSTGVVKNGDDVYVEEI